MGQIIQSIAWTNATEAATSPASVRAQGTAFRLSGAGLTVNGKAVKSVTIPVGDAEAAFVAAVTSGKRTVKVTRNTRGRPRKVATMDAAFASTLRKATATAPRKARKATPAPEPTPEQ